MRGMTIRLWKMREMKGNKTGFRLEYKYDYICERSE